MTTILQLLPADLYNVCEGARSFFEEMKLPGTFKAAHFTTVWSTLMNLNIGTIFAAFKDGECIAGIGAIMFPDACTGDIIVTEAFWYVVPKHRKGTIALKLLNEFEAWAKKRNATRVRMGMLVNSPSTVKELYTRRGYHPLETHYEKQL